MRLSTLLAGIEYTLIQGDADADIAGLCYDSRLAAPGDMFVCISGYATDGHLFAAAALEKGVTALLTEKPVQGGGATVLRTADCRAALPRAAANLYGRPSRDLHLAGVTGTNGKTSVTHFIRDILESWGRKTGLMGTLYACIGEKIFPMERTTPEAVEIERFLRYCVDKQAEYAVMEVSSHALALQRVEELHFRSALFTNLTQDHLDYHQTMEAYFLAKAKLFAMLPAAGFGVLNADAPESARLKGVTSAPVVTFGINQPADVALTAWRGDKGGTDFTVRTANGEMDLRVPLLGRFNLYNALAALAWAECAGVPPEIIRTALAGLKGAPGRYEQVDAGQDFTVIVDYAHTPDGLQNVLAAARDMTAGRLITVFGCGGNRDRTKRPLMGGIAAELSDIAVVTSDNPRDEAPEAIIEDIMAGISAGASVHQLTDRRQAIAAALLMADPGDVVVIAGKGHEDYQLIKGQKLAFDDRLVARQWLERRKSCR